MRYLPLLIILIQVYICAQSPHGTTFARECVECHTTASWKISAEELKFDHSSTGFTLSGQHKNVNCIQCHGSLVFDKAKPECSSCHNDMHKASVSPDCATCHNTNSWLVTDIYRLHQAGRFPLAGAHRTADCIQCHTGAAELNFESPGISCYECHKADFNATSNPNHVASGFSKDCEQCHSMLQTRWALSEFAHAFFPLTGGHAIPNCFACHSSGNFTGLSKDCFSCHSNDYASVTDPNHTANNFSTTCTSCHSINGWKPANFNHSTTSFPLTGRHITVVCADCHSSGYAGTPTTCNSCHNDNYLATTNPNHQGAGFPVACETCHTTGGWTPAQFDHDQLYFPIYSGKHRNEWQQCSDCHTSASNYSVFSCVDCHEHNKQDMDDEHNDVSGYIYQSSACLSCHPDGNTLGAFNHSLSQFPLTGAHIAAECSDCHVSGFSTSPSVECAACHTNERNNASSPDHTAAGFTGACTECHTTTAWLPASYDHGITGFQLAGAHANVNCSNCHTSQYQGTEATCQSCHISAYNNAVNPNHLTSGLPQNCSECHSSTAWIPSSFDHASTGFQLSGGHALSACSDCHSGSVTTASGVCSDCHQDDFAAATNPNHTLLGLSSLCSDCHTTNPGWSPASFPVHNNYYILAGAHFNIRNNCVNCHNGNYTNTPNTCYACHTQDYNSATNPNHVSLRFPEDCTDCHGQSSWTPSTFNHDQQYFPIFSGKHRNEWSDCQQCHTNPANFAVFSCVTCHEHNRTDMDNEHSGVNGYQYLSSACFDCHPDGEDRSLRHPRKMTD